MDHPAVPGLSWKFPRPFWVADAVELFERAEDYTVFVALSVYLANVVGFDDVDAAWIGPAAAVALFIYARVVKILDARRGMVRS